jgi:acetolactate synthase-1/3 small subunit
LEKQFRDHIVALVVENKPGVLFRVTNMIRRRGFNIESLSVGAINSGKLARMSIVIKGDERTVEQVTKNLHKLVETVKVAPLESSDSVLRELALVKVRVDDSKIRSDLMHYTRIFRGRVIDVGAETMIIEITGDPEKINAFLNLIKGYGIKELARTGITALARGSKSLHIRGT